MKRPTPFPTWVSVLAALERLPDDAPVTLPAFRTINAEPDWHFAVSNYGPDGPSGPHPGPSPWISLVAGQSSATIRRLVPLWATSSVLPVTQAQAFENAVEGTPELRRRLQLATAVANVLIQYPHDWVWLKALLEALNPDPLRFSLDDDDEDDFPFDDRRSRHPSPARQQSRVLAPPPPVAVTTGAAPRPASTRPSLRRPGGHGN